MGNIFWWAFFAQLPLHYIFSKIYVIHYLLLFHNLIHSNRNSYCSTNHRVVTHTKFIYFRIFYYNVSNLVSLINTRIKDILYILLYSIIIYYFLSNFIFGGQMVGKNTCYLLLNPKVIPNLKTFTNSLLNILKTILS